MDYESAVQKAISLGADFCDLRVSDNHSSTIILKDSETDKVNSGSSLVYSMRVLYGGCLGFASSNDLSRLDEVTRRAVKFAKNSKKNLSIELASADPVNDHKTIKFRKNPLDYSLGEKLRLIKDIEALGREDPLVKSTTVAYTENLGTAKYINSEGSYIEVQGGSTLLTSMSFVKGKILQSGYVSEGGLIGCEILDRHSKICKKSTQKAKRLSTAKLAPSGKFTIVTDPKMSGTLAHESIGHAAEADYILKEASVLRTRKNRQIGSAKVTIVDDPTVDRAFGSYFYDSEGIKSRRNVLVDRGVLKGFLHSRHTANLSGDEPTGNGRAAVDERPIVRMSNTFFEPGKDSEDDLFDIDYGIFVKGLTGGSVNTAKGDFQFACEEGFIIRKGELKECLRDITLIGNLLTVLKNVEMVGRKKKLDPGICVKDGKSIPVTSGGPKLRIRGVLVAGH